MLVVESSAVRTESISSMADGPFPQINFVSLGTNPSLMTPSTFSTMKFVDAMAGIGNDAAHAEESLESDDVKRLGRDVATFLARFGS